MEDARANEQLGKVIQFPTSRQAPPPLPKLPRATPLPGYRPSAGMFSAALTARFDRDAA